MRDLNCSCEPTCCNCKYKYRLTFSEKKKIWGAQIGEQRADEGIEIIASLGEFDEQNEACAAAWGFIEALYYLERKNNVNTIN